jgi:mRNA interferase MazF
LLRKGSTFLIALPARTGGPHAAGRASLTRPEAGIEGQKCRILLEQMLAVDVSKLTNWIGVMDDHEMEALDDALRLYHGLS